MYSELNLPNSMTVNSKTVVYAHTAGGTKIRNLIGTKNLYYIGNFVYKGSSLKYILHDEGSIVINANSATYEHHLKDHLENTRIAFQENQPKSTQFTDYYSFGLAMNMSEGSRNKFLYKGKELQDETDWLDYGARMYEPTLGRFMTVDPKAEKYLQWSPYNYVGGNPIRRIDVNGESWDDVGKMIKSYVARKINQTANAVANAAVQTVKNIANDIVDNTKLQTTAELKVTEEIGVQFDIKGEGGGGVSRQLSEASMKLEVNTSVNDGVKGGIVFSDNKDVKNQVFGQIKGNGASYTHTKSENGTISSEGKLTTSTGIPLVQSETSLKTDSKGGLEVASGVASGVKTPFTMTPVGTTLHFSFDLGIKLIYTKKGEE